MSLVGAQLDCGSWIRLRHRSGHYPRPKSEPVNSGAKAQSDCSGLRQGQNKVPSGGVIKGKLSLAVLGSFWGRTKCCPGCD